MNIKIQQKLFIICFVIHETYQELLILLFQRLFQMTGENLCIRLKYFRKGISLKSRELCEFDNLNKLKKHLIKSSFHTKKVQFLTIYALKFRSCLNLIKYTYTILNTCVYKVQVMHFYSVSKKNNNFNIMSYFKMQSKMMKTDTFTQKFLKRKMCLLPSPIKKTNLFHVIKL